MQLYVISACPYCVKAQYVLQSKGVKYETITVPTEDRSKITEISGQEKVPVLVDGQQVVSDSTEIARYLEEKFPEPPLRAVAGVPPGLSDLLEDWSDEVFAGHVFDYAWEKYKPEEEGPTDHALMERSMRLIDADMRMLCEALHQQAFLLGGQPSVADAAVWSCLKIARDGKLLDMKPSWGPVNEWLQRMDERVAVQLDLSYIDEHRRRD
ncbi:MAG: glutathione S-transferase family protein [Acidobacteriota bacterium]